MKPYVSELHSNVKGERAVKLAPLTILTGDNGSGKTGILSALRLALLGEDPHLGKAGVELLKLLPGGEGELYATATCTGIDSDALSGTKCHFSVKGSRGKAARPVHAAGFSGTILDGVVRSVLAKGAARAREAILKVAAPRDVLSLARIEVPEVFRNDWDNAIRIARAEAGADAPEADVLVATAEVLRDQHRSAKKLSGGDPGARPARLDDAEIGQIRARAEKVGAVLQNLHKRDAARGALFAPRAALTVVLDDDDSDTVPGFDKAKVAEMRHRLEALKTVYDMNKERANAGQTKDGPEFHCVACGAHWMDAYEGQAISIENLEANVSRMETALKTVGVRPADKIRAEIERLEAAEAEALQQLPEGARAVEASVVAARAAEIGEELRSAEEAVRAAAAWDSARSDQAAASSRLISLDALKKAADRVVTGALQTGLAAFCKVASAPLGDSGQIDIRLFEGRRAVCDVGLVRAQEFTPWDALCGAEQSLALTGLATAWAGASTESVKVITVDDVWMGKAALSSLLRALSDAVQAEDGPTQAVVCAVELHQGAAITARNFGWTIVEV